MANFANTAAGRATAAALVKTRMISKAWVNGHYAIDKSGNTIVRFQRMRASTSATTQMYGGWTESRSDAEA
jgi:hypothetical protein